MTSLLVVDNHDSFTFTLVDYLLTLGATVEVVESDSLSLAAALDRPVDGFLLSPGPGHPDAAGISVALAAACIAERRPLFGVCLGHQAIARAVGIPVVRTAPVHGKPVACRHDGSGLFAGLPSPISVARYNSLTVASANGALLVNDALVANGALVANAWDDNAWDDNACDGPGILGLRHRDAPVHGVQFHPESIVSEHGHAILGAFLVICH